MFCILKNQKVYLSDVSRHNSNGEKQVILLMIPDEEKWHYIAVESLTALLRRITPKCHGDFCFLNCLHSFATENKTESHKKVCENKDFCNVVMSSEDNKILELNQYQKLDKAPFTIYEDLKCLIEKIDRSKNNPEKHPQVDEHIP